MTTISLSTKFQIVIPQKIRNQLKLTSGMKIEVIAFDGRIELIPIQSIKSLKGAFKGMDTTLIRDKDRL